MGRPPKNPIGANADVKPVEKANAGDDENMLTVQPEPKITVAVDTVIVPKEWLPERLGSADVEKMTWTKIKPTVAGAYYYREVGMLKRMYLEIEILSGIPFAVLGPLNKMAVMSLKGEFFGPLPEPPA